MVDLGAAPVFHHHRRYRQMRVRHDVEVVLVQEQHAVARRRATGEFACELPQRLRLVQRPGGHRGNAYDGREDGTRLPQPAQRARPLDACRYGVAHQERERHGDRQDVAHQLGIRQGEEQRDKAEPQPHQQAQRPELRICPVATAHHRGQPGKPWQREDGQHDRVEPERLHVVEAGLRKPLEVLHDEEVVGEFRIAQLHGDEPRRGDCNEEQDRRPPQ